MGGSFSLPIPGDGERKIANLEKEVRRKNLIVHGLEEGQNYAYFKLENQVLDLLRKEVKVDLKDDEIDFVRRIRKKVEGKTRPIVFGLTTYRKKVLILKNKRNLKDKTIYITEVFPKEVVIKRKELKEQMLEERKKGKFAIISYDKLIIRDGKESERKKRRASNGTPGKDKEGKHHDGKVKVKKVKDKETADTKNLNFFFRDRTNSESSSGSVYSSKNTKSNAK